MSQLVSRLQQVLYSDVQREVEAPHQVPPSSPVLDLQTCAVAGTDIQPIPGSRSHFRFGTRGGMRGQGGRVSVKKVDLLLCWDSAHTCFLS